MIEFTFEFSLAKLVHSIAYFSVSGLSDLTKLKLVKLLYFADKTHLLESASPILGDVYYCMDFGPVPSFALNEMNEAITRGESREGQSDRTFIDSVLKVRKPIWARYPRFEARHANFERSVFSESELAALQQVRDRYGNCSASELVALTHQEPTWCIPNASREQGKRAQIPYDLFFVGCGEQGQRSLALLTARFRGEVIPLPGDAAYRDFASLLVEDQTEIDWSVDRDISNRATIQSFR